MEVFNAREFTANGVVLTTTEELFRLYDLLDKDENFILKCGKEATLIIATNMSARVKTGAVVLMAIE